jgi:hypothetical protein
LKGAVVRIDSSLIIAVATSVYGAATLLLVIQIWRDRVQREKHFNSEGRARKLNDLHSAFYEAWGYWEGFAVFAGSPQKDASQIGRQFEALIRLECQLRLNHYKAEADNIGIGVRAGDTHKIKSQIDAAGVALGLLPREYRHSGTRRD